MSNNFHKPKLLDAASAGSDLVAAMRMTEATALSMIASWTGTPTGTLELWASNDESPDPAVDADWTLLSAATFSANPSGSAGSALLDVRGVFFQWVRFKFDYTSGSGALSVAAKAKSE